MYKILSNVIVIDDKTYTWRCVATSPFILRRRNEGLYYHLIYTKNNTTVSTYVKSYFATLFPKQR